VGKNKNPPDLLRRG